MGSSFQSKNSEAFDVLLVAAREDLSATEIADLLSSKGYSVRSASSSAASNLARRGQLQTLILLLTKETDESYLSLVLEVLETDNTCKVVLLQMEECAIGSLLSFDLLVDLRELNPEERRSKILGSLGGPRHQDEIGVTDARLDQQDEIVMASERRVPFEAARAAESRVSLGHAIESSAPAKDVVEFGVSHPEVITVGVTLS